MRLLLAIFGAAISGLLYYNGYKSGGWSQELGQVYYCYATYIALDASSDFVKWLSK